MDLLKVNKIYQKEKEGLLLDLMPQEKPLAFILGGQPASGKSNLANVIISQFPEKNFLFVK